MGIVLLGAALLGVNCLAWRSFCLEIVLLGGCGKESWALGLWTVGGIENVDAMLQCLDSQSDPRDLRRTSLHSIS